MTHPAACRAHGSLLLVEDDEDAAALTTAHFRRHGYDVVHVATYRDALSTAESRDFSLVVLDLMLHGHNGAGLVTELSDRDGTKHAPVVVSSILDRREYPRGIAGALPKPFTRADVAKLVAHLDTVAG